MIVVNKSLPSIGYALDPLSMELRCLHDNGSSFAASGKQQSIVFQETYTYPNSTIKIDWKGMDLTNHTITFTMKEDVVLDTDLPVWHEYVPPRKMKTFESYLQTLVDAISQNIRYSEFFKVYLSGTTIIIQCDDELVLNFNVSAQDLAVSLPPQTLSIAISTPINYRLLYKVIVLNSDIFSGFDTPSPFGFVPLDFSGILKKYGFSKSIIPPNVSLMATHIAQNWTYYVVAYAEEFGSPVVRKDWVYENRRQSVLATTYNNIDPWDFLNTLPDSRYVASDAPEFLAWCNKSSGSFNLRMEIETTDRTTGLISTQTVAALKANQVVMISVLKYQTVANPAVVRVRLIHGSTNAVLSKWRTYLMDDTYYEHTRYLAFFNKYGVWEMVRFTGALAQATEVKRRDVSKYTGNSLENATADVDWSRSFTYRTGWKSQAKSMALENLVASPKVCEVSALGYIPLRLTDTKYTPDDGQKEDFAWEIKAVPTTSFNTVTQDFWIKW